MPNDYPTLFRTYLARRLRQMHGIVASDDFVRSPRQQEQALRLLDYALAEPVELAATCALLIVMAPKMEMAGYRDEWAQYLKNGIKVSSRFGLANARAEFEYELAILCLRQSRFVEAEKRLAISRSYFEQFACDFGIAKTLNQMAYAAYLQHQYAHAAKLAQQALAISQADAIQATGHTVYGLIALDLANWPEAENWHRKALQLYEQTKDSRRTGISLLNIAYALRGAGKYIESIAIYEKAEGHFSNLGDVYYLAHVYMNLGIAYRNLNHIPRALEFYAKAKAIWQRQQDMLNLARISTNGGIAYYELEEFKSAEAMFHTSIDLYKRLNDEAGRLNAIDGLAMVLLAQGRFAEVVDILEQNIAELPKIVELPNHDYLRESMTNHLIEARNGSGR